MNGTDYYPISGDTNLHDLLVRWKANKTFDNLSDEETLNLVGWHGWQGYLNPYSLNKDGTMQNIVCMELFGEARDTFEEYGYRMKVWFEDIDYRVVGGNYQAKTLDQIYLTEADIDQTEKGKFKAKVNKNKNNENGKTIRDRLVRFKEIQSKLPSDFPGELTLMKAWDELHKIDNKIFPKRGKRTRELFFHSAGIKFSGDE